MTSISENQLAAVLDEIASAMRSDTPIHQALGRLQNRQLGAVGRIAGNVASHIEAGGSPADAFAGEEPMQKIAAGAIEISQRTGSGSILSRVASHLRQRSQFRRQSHIGWFYPILLAFLAYSVFAGVMAPLVVANFSNDFQWASWVHSVSKWTVQYWPIPPLIGLIVVILLWLRSRQFSSLPSDVSKSLMYESIADQIELDIPVKEAIQSAMMLAGHPETVASSVIDLNDPLIKSEAAIQDFMQPVGASEGSGSSSTSNASSSSDESDMVNVTGEKVTTLMSLRYLASYHADRWRRRTIWRTEVLPRFGMIAIAGGTIFLYAFWVIAPVYFQVRQW